MSVEVKIRKKPHGVDVRSSRQKSSNPFSFLEHGSTMGSGVKNEAGSGLVRDCREQNETKLFGKQVEIPSVQRATHVFEGQQSSGFF